MIEQLTGVPAGTLAFRSSGRITSDEYRRMMEPIYAALERGEKVNIYFELAGDFHGLVSGASRRASSIPSRGRSQKSFQPSAS